MDLTILDPELLCCVELFLAWGLLLEIFFVSLWSWNIEQCSVGMSLVEAVSCVGFLQESRAHVAVRWSSALSCSFLFWEIQLRSILGPSHHTRKWVRMGSLQSLFWQWSYMPITPRVAHLPIFPLNLWALSSSCVWLPCLWLWLIR